MNYIQKYKEYISFLNENRARLLDADNWDILFQVLPLLKLSPGYTLDDFRSKASTNNILCLYARKTDTRSPSEKAFKRYDEENSFSGVMPRLFKKRDILNFIDRVTVAEDDDEIENNDVIEEIDEPLNLHERILPEEVVTLDFVSDAIWQAYLLKTTDYYIGQRWHGGYHEMTIPKNLEELMNFRPWKENEIQEYEKFINKTKFDFEPQITTDGNVATIEHLAVFFHNNISRCRATVFYNSETRRIESFEFDSTDLFTFSPHYIF